MATTYLTCVPAYGRDYKTMAAVKADYAAGKDFKILSGPYISKAEVEKNPGMKLEIRYDKLTKVIILPEG